MPQCVVNWWLRAGNKDAESPLATFLSPVEKDLKIILVIGGTVDYKNWFCSQQSNLC